MKTELVQCASCGTSFEKVSKEIKRSIKLGREQYCSRACAGKSINNIAHLNRVNPLDASHLQLLSRVDEFSPFRPHLRRANMRGTKEVSITLEDLKEVWEQQNGMCVYSNVKLTHSNYSGYNDPIYTTSLDRIDSSKGYVKGNIQFISITMNHMKNSMTHEKMLEAISVFK